MNGKMLHAETQFNTLLGAFYQFWSAAEMLSSLAIGILLGIPDEETHLLTARMEFSRKAGLIRELLRRRPHPKASEIKAALNRIQNESKRNVFAHSIIYSDEHTITFLERGWEGDFFSRTHPFTLDEFAKHVHAFSKSRSTNLLNRMNHL